MRKVLGLGNAATRKAHAYLALALGLWASGCGDGETGIGLLEFCYLDSECRSGACVDDSAGLAHTNFCSQPCSAQQPCPAVDGVQLVCAPGNRGSFCTRPCAEDAGLGTPGSKLTCVDGVPTDCSALPADEASLRCEVCGCPSDQYCGAQGCAPLGAAGEPCMAHANCMSANCGASAMGDATSSRCLAALGSPCTPDTCQTCSLHGQALCTRPCDSDYDCPSRWNCIGSDRFGDGVGWIGTCRPRCYNGMPLGSHENCPSGWLCRLKDNASWCESD